MEKVICRINHDGIKEGEQGYIIETENMYDIIMQWDNGILENAELASLILI